MIILIDNYDSFTFNLVHYFGGLGAEVAVHRNDKIAVTDILAAEPEAIVLSPGPCTPNDAGICLDLIKQASATIPIFGVCLGHQAIGQVFGGRVVRAPKVFHGKSSEIQHDGKTIFAGLTASLKAGRYHSLIVDSEGLPSCLEVSATTRDGIIMGLRHREMKIEGVQFHPESIMTTEGKKLLANFLSL